ncbi:MAG: 1-acyl-sn-glycerol-3-phosphate acyltransferase [Clostridiales bacterium]|nr:1-acyl-sn-glycerol-3-phosphate acyltransferase [Clostridiales bacterium]
MNTKQYMAMFARLAESGELPRDLYDKMLAEIAQKGKMTKSIYNDYLTELERRRLFDVDGAPFTTEKSAQTDGTYVYRHPKNPFWHFAHWFWSTTFKLIGFVGGAIVFGVWHVKGRKKLKKLGPCITTSNHVGYLDAVLTLRATGMQNRYIVAAPHNCKKTVGGHILCAAGEVPLPISFKGMRPFNDMLDYAAHKKKAKIHFYAEKSMWIDYRKPRPYKDGAFHYAERLDIPVVPMLYCFKKPRGLRKLLHLPKAVIKIGEPLYVNTELPPMERKTDLAQRTYAAAVEIYEQFYGEPMTYLEPLATDSVGIIDSDGATKEND